MQPSSTNCLEANWRQSNWNKTCIAAYIIAAQSSYRACLNIPNTLKCKVGILVWCRGLMSLRLDTCKFRFGHSSSYSKYSSVPVHITCIRVGAFIYILVKGVKYVVHIEVAWSFPPLLNTCCKRILESK